MAFARGTNVYLRVYLHDPRTYIAAQKMTE